MASYVMIRVDTQSPTIAIYAPDYTTKETYNQITVESDEPLDTYQDIYLIDNLGTRHDFVFQRESSTKYVGYIQLATVPVGLHTFYARMRDEVRNYSELVSSVIEVRPSLDGTDGNLIKTIVRDEVLIPIKVQAIEKKRHVESEQRKVKIEDAKVE